MFLKHMSSFFSIFVESTENNEINGHASYRNQIKHM